MPQQVSTRRSPRAFWARVGILVLSSTLGWGGIGHSAGPSFTSDVVVSSTNPDFVLENTGDGEADWQLETDEPVGEGFGLTWIDGGRRGHPVVIENQAPSNALYIERQGKIGFGTASPRASLHLADGAPAIHFEDTTSSSYEWQLNTNGGLFNVHDVTASSTPFSILRGARDAALRIGHEGNIGLGTFHPSEAVDVVRSGQASRFQLTSFSNNAADAAQFIQRRARGTRTTPGATQNGDNLGLFSFRGMRPNGNFSGSQATITAQATQNWTNEERGTRLVFGTTQNGTSAVRAVMEITHDGRVLINGSQLSVPDYVFAEDYKLMPLDELQAYINEHHHLPEVASEAEVQASGVDLGGTQMALLKKIEELTLYTLEQHQQLTQQHQQLAKQDEQLAAVAEKNTVLVQQNAALVEQQHSLEEQNTVLTQRLAATEVELRQHAAAFERRLAALEQPH